MDSLQGSLTAMSELFTCKMDEFQKQLQQSSSTPSTSALATDFAAFRLFVLSALDTVQKQIEFVARQMERLDMRSRRKILLFHGVPEDKGEAATEVVTNLISSKLKISGLSTNSLSRCHRLGRPMEKRPRPLLVKFREVSVRDKIWFAKAKLKGTGVTQSEFLTKSRHSVFMRARQLYGITKCWTRDGVINVLAPDGSHHRVECLAELEAIPSAPVGAGSLQTAPSASKPHDGREITRTKRLQKNK